MGLARGDLGDLVRKTIDIDSHTSKMGEDKDVITLAFSVKNEEPAKDLVKFIEAGYNFVLDSAVSSGEQDDGFYRVFVELPRDSKAVEHILSIIKGVKLLANISDPRFRYYKNFKSKEATQEELESTVITDPDKYDVQKKLVENQSVSKFFSKSIIDTAYIVEGILTLKKVYSDPIHFRVVDFGPKDYIFKNLNESYNFNDFGEIIFMVKYLGDYDITKYGNKLVVESEGNCLVIERL